MTFARPLALALMTAALLAPVSAGATTPAAVGPDARPELRATFDNNRGADGKIIRRVKLSGSAELDADILTLGGGALRSASGRPGKSRAVRFPAFDGSVGAPRAVIKVTNATGEDQIDPGTANFSYGADFMLDAQSSGVGTDDGDNLLQRGLFDDPAQFKLQVDDRRPSCRIAGADVGPAVALVRSSVVVDSTHWYRAECTRDGRTLTIAVTRFNDDGTKDTTRTSTTSDGVIDVTVSAPSIPLSIGGALTADGAIYTRNDQFNGLIDNVTLQIN